jgi:hypothetical protein
MGKEWSETHLTENNMHFAMNNKLEPVFLPSSMAKEERDPAIILTVHGFFMFVSWGILLPGGILSAQFLKHANGDLWFKLHPSVQWLRDCIHCLNYA